MLRHGRHGHVEDTSGRAGPAHYRMRQKLVSIGDDYWIENDRGERVFKVNGKALRIRKTMVLEDAYGHELLHIEERMLHLRDTMKIEDMEGHTRATVHKALISPLRERWLIDVEHGPDLHVHGNIVDHEYRIQDGHTTVAEVSKRWFRIADTYGVEVAPGEDHAMMLAITAVLDATAHEGA